MKKSDTLTLIGLLGGIVLLGFSMATGDGGLAIFWDFASVLITVGGSFAAVCMTFWLKQGFLFEFIGFYHLLFCDRRVDCDERK